MHTFLICLALFTFGYVLNMFYITVLYHRALTHQAIELSPFMMKWLGWTGTWITGLEPKAWAAMHRQHHEHSDTIKDPHSPTHLGLMGVWLGQYEAYKTMIEKLLKKDDLVLNESISDIPFEISVLNRRNLSVLPYIIHSFIGVALASGFDSFWIGLAYFLGIMSHPVQGWLVNALAHRYGGRNFETPDDSRNNLWVAWFVFGEGLQNNHHALPGSANFSQKTVELDLGYWMCVVAEKCKLLKINRA